MKISLYIFIDREQIDSCQWSKSEKGEGLKKNKPKKLKSQTTVWLPEGKELGGEKVKGE